MATWRGRPSAAGVFSTLSERYAVPVGIHFVPSFRTVVSLSRNHSAATLVYLVFSEVLKQKRAVYGSRRPRHGAAVPASICVSFFSAFFRLCVPFVYSWIMLHSCLQQLATFTRIHARYLTEPDAALTPLQRSHRTRYGFAERGAARKHLH